MEKKKYHYVYQVYTDNLGWGRTFLGESIHKEIANYIGRTAGKGCFVVERKRKYNE